jgi:hypothetical protein
VDAPGGRYKIIERGRRLVTIDTLTGQEVTTIPAASNPPITDTGRDKITAAPKRASGTGSAMGGPDRGVQSMGTPRSTANTSMTVSSNIDLTTIAALMPGARRDETGRILLMTQAYYDPRAPRLVRLTPAKAKSLGGMGVAMAFLALFALFVGFQFSFIFVFVMGFVLLRSAKSIIKPAMQSLITDAEELR